MIIKEKLKILLWIIIIMGMNEGLILGAQEYDIRQESLVQGIPPTEHIIDVNIDHLEVRMFAYVNDDNVRIRTIPSVSDGVIIGVKNRRAKVAVLGKSSFLEKIGRKKYRWLQIEWEEQKGWIYGEYIDLETRDIQALPVMRMYESKIGKVIEGYRKKERELVVTDLDTMIKNYDTSLTEDDEMIGSVIDLSKKSNFIRTYRIPSGMGGMPHSPYSKKYGVNYSFDIDPLWYKGHIILLLFGGSYYSKESLLDYKVIPDALNNYQAVDDTDHWGSFVKIDGISRISNFPTIVMILGNEPVEYRKLRNDVKDAYVVDIGTKKYVKIQDQSRLSFLEMPFTD